MTHAYQEIYLSKAQTLLGEAFDYAINTCKINGDSFTKQFIVSTISRRIENGEPNIISGKSGIEIVIEIVKETTGKELNISPQAEFGRSTEYWIGWAIAYYQWYSGRKFSQIFKVISFEKLQNMYYTLHESDISKFTDILNLRIQEYFNETNLKRIRTSYGYTQSELANHSGVSLRSIQMYEQRKKDINKAGVDAVYRISKALGCTIEDLIER